jgi:beta-glucosidase
VVGVARARRALLAGKLGRARAGRTVVETAVAMLVAAAGLSYGVAGAAANGCGTHPWCNSGLAAAQRARLMLGAMTTAEKLELVSSGSSGIARLGIPALHAVDGPNGVGEGSTHVTAFPDAETIGASWDSAVARAYGQALGTETAGKGFDWLFAPTINIVRTPLWGREAETLGEDPFLTGSLAAQEIRGIQSRHVIAEVKHYAGNNQEIDRFGQTIPGEAVSDQVSERALEEIYLPAFKAAVQQGRVGSVMCSYNRINTLYSCQDPQTLGTLKSFGLQGFVGPDASLAVRDDVAAVNAGLDNLQLGSLATATGQSELAILTSAYNSGRLSAARLDDATRRILTAMFAVGLFHHPQTGGAQSDVSTRAHLRLATRVAEQATVLLRNRRGVLPLSPRVASIAVIGHDAGPGTQIEENGSPAVLHGPVITPLAGIKSLLRGRSRITYAPGTRGVVVLPDIPSRMLTPTGGQGHGLSASYYSGQTPSGRPVATRVEPTVDFASKPGVLTPIPNTPGAAAGLWTGTLTPPRTGVYRFSLAVAGVAQLYVDGHLVVNANAEYYRADLPGGFISDPGGPTLTFQGLARLTKHRPVSIRVQYATGASISGAALKLGWQPPDPSMLARAVSAARHVKVAVVFANDVSGEGMDRPSLELPGDQDRLIEAVAAANPRTIVVLHTAGPVLMPWLHKVEGVLEAWYPGQQSGSAIAATLFGQADPAGRLPVTFARSSSQGPATKPAQYPGIDNLAQYSEGIFVGYRYYDRHQQAPLFPFGYGLSYTTFSLSRLHTHALTGGRYRVSVQVRNAGPRRGYEVVELYLGFPAAAAEPPRQLKAFAKLFLGSRQRRNVTLTLPRSAFMHFSQTHGRWVLTPGRYRVSVGNSSRNLPLSAQVTVR